MKFYNKLSIRYQLIAVFCIKILFFSLFFIVAVVGLSRIQKVTDNIYTNPLIVTNDTLEILAKSTKIHRDIKNAILLVDPVEQQINLKEIDDLKQEIDDLFTIIDSKISEGGENKLAFDTRNMFNQWNLFRISFMFKATSGNKEEAVKMANTEGNKMFESLEVKIRELYTESKIKADQYMKESETLQSNFCVLLVVMFVVLSLLSYIVFIVVYKNLLHSINTLKTIITESTTSHTLKKAVFLVSNEISEMAIDYNNLISDLEKRIWVKDGINKLNEALYDKNTSKQLSQSAINFLSRYLDSGHGVFLKYETEDETLRLIACFACNEKDTYSDIIDMNYGIIGQVALERKPILLTNIKNTESLITTGTTNNAPLNTYSFPLVYEDILYGVIELSSYEPFTKLKQDFLNETSAIISINLHSVLQRDKIHILLAEAEIARKSAEDSSNQLSKQTESLYGAHTQLEEQQQILKQKSEQLQQNNIQLEEQRQSLEQQTDKLEIKNIELVDKAVELQLSHKYKSEFIANISHELRTPLNSIILLSKGISKGENSSLSEIDKEKAAIIHNSGNNLLRLVNNILDISKIEASKSELKLSRFNSKDFLYKFDEMFRSFAVDKQLEFLIEDKINQTLFSDMEKLSQIIINFLSNAFKFTDKGTISLKISMSGDTIYPVAISVSDTGIGISQENMDKIFDAFYQIDASTQRKFGGTGLGLHICSQLSEMLGTSIKINSVPGSGSEFILLLPQSFIKHPLSITNLPEDDRKSIIQGDTSLLIIEDDVSLSLNIMEISKTLGIKTLFTSLCDEGLSLAKKYIPSGIILDLDINNTKGLETLKVIKTDILLRSIPIVLISDNQTDVLIGADDCLTKPVNSKILKKLIKKLLGLQLVEEEKTHLITTPAVIPTKDTSNTNAKKYDENSMKGKTILIVDDDPKNIFIMAAALEKYGANVIEALNGNNVLGVLKEKIVDMILIDIMIPEIDGYQRIKEIRNTPRIKNLSIIALTAKSLEHNKQKCIESGANDYISKPVDLNILISVVSAWLDNK